MESLAKRHDDRAQRLANNRGEYGNVLNPLQSLPSVGTALAQYQDFMNSFNQIEAYHPDPAVVQKLKDGMAAIEAEVGGSGRSLSEAPDGSGDTMAGIGVVNTQVVPASVLAVSTDGGGGGGERDAAWGDIPPVTEEGLPEPELPEEEGSNLAGDALSKQLGKPGGWGEKGSPSSADLRDNKDKKPQPAPQPAKAPEKDNK